MFSEGNKILRLSNNTEEPTSNDSGNSNPSEGTDTYHHLVLIHGIKGNCKEMGYVKRSIENTYKRSSERKNSRLIVHSATCNEKNSTDGIEAGGHRVAKEINDVLRELSNDIVDEHTQAFDLTKSSEYIMNQKIALSIIGYSMGGLYGRFAIRYIDWIVQIDMGSAITGVVVVPHVFATIATPHLGMKGMSYFNVPECFESLAGIIFGKSGIDVFRRNISKRGGTRNCSKVIKRRQSSLLNVELNDEHKEQYEYTDIIERLSFDPSYVGPLARFSRRIAYANAFSTDIAVPMVTAAFLFDDDRNSTCNPQGYDAQHPALKHSSHLFIREFIGHEKTIQNSANCQEEENGIQYAFVRFDTLAVRNKTEFKIAMKKPPSVSDMARNLDSLGWSKVFIDARPYIPSIWKRPSGKGRELRRNSFEEVMNGELCGFKDQNQDKVPCYSSGALKRQLSGRGFHGTTLPFGHSFIVASTKGRMCKRLYKSARPIVDRAIAKEIVDEMLTFNSEMAENASVR